MNERALRSGLALARLLPPRAFVAGAAACGWLASYLSPARSIVRGNLVRIAGASAAGELRPGRVFASYGRYWGEFLSASVRTDLPAQFAVRAIGEEHLLRAARRGPVCILTGHLGNWDLGARWAQARLPGLAVLAETLEPARLFGLFRELRARGGLKVIAAEGGGVRLYRHLRRGGHAAIVADRPFGNGEVREAPFFGGWRAFPAAGLLVARRAGAALLPAFLHRENRSFVVRVHPPIGDDEDPLESFVRTLREEISAWPEQWCVLEPICTRERDPDAGVSERPRSMRTRPTDSGLDWPLDAADDSGEPGGRALDGPTPEPR